MFITSFQVADDKVKITYLPSSLSDSTVSLSITRISDIRIPEDLVEYLTKDLQLNPLMKNYGIQVAGFKAIRQKGTEDYGYKFLLRLRNVVKDVSFDLYTPEYFNTELDNMVYVLLQRIKEFIKKQNKQLELFPADDSGVTLELLNNSLAGS